MVNLKRITNKKLGELLVDEKVLTLQQVQDALREQQKTGGLLGEVLVRLGYLTELDIAHSLCVQFNLPFLPVTAYRLQVEAMRLIPLELQRRYQFVVLDKIGAVVIIATAGILNEYMFQDIADRTASDVQVFVSTTTDVTQALDEYLENRV